MFGLISRRERREIAELEEYITRLRAERDKARAERDTAVYNRQQIGRQLAEADAANKRLAGRNSVLQERLEQREDYTEAAYVVQVEKRLDRLARGTARWMAALWAERAESIRLARQAGEADRRVLNLVREVAEIRDARRHIDGGSPRPLPPSAELIRARAQTQDLEQRLADMTIANRQCTCQRPLAKDGGA